MPRIWSASLLGVGSTLVFLSVTGWQGRELVHPRRPGTWLTGPLDGLAALLAGDGQRGQRLGFLLLALICLAAWRNCRRALLAYRPGPVDVHDFTDATPDHLAPVDQLKSQLCQQLAETRLHLPHGGPADASAENALDLGSGLESKSTHPVVLALQLLPRLWPRVAYRVNGVLRVRDEEPRYGVTVTVTSFLGGGRSATGTEWGRTWDEAVSRTACWVLATILPVTRLGRDAPWRAWWGRQLPVALYAAWYRGRQSQLRRHFDEALWHYGEALRLDPGNADLRLLVAGVQEEMGMYLHALDTYQSALVLDEQGGWYAEHLWTTRADRLRRLPAHLLGTLRHLRRQPDSIELRYRYACALAHTERTVPPWFMTGADGQQRAHRQLTDRLTQVFVERYWPAAVAFADQPGEQATRHWLRAVLREHPEATATLFQIIAAQELYRLHEDVTWARLVPGVRCPVTRSALRVLRDVWVPLRLARAWHVWGRRGWSPVRLPATAREPVRPYAPGGGLARWWRPGPRQRAARLAARWPCPPELVIEAVESSRHRLLPGPAPTPLDFFHAACAYGFALSGHLLLQDAPRAGPTSTTSRILLFGRRLIMYSLPSIHPPGRPRPAPAPRTATDHAPPPLAGPVASLAGRAVDELRAALTGTDSGVAAERVRQWILHSGPDLAPLRRLPGSGYLEEERYPNRQLTFPRPDEMIWARMAAYVRELVQQGAVLLAETWHERAALAPQPAVRWLDLDAELWAALDRLASGEGGYWRDRMEFIRLLRVAVDPVRLASAGFPPAIPHLDEVALTGPGQHGDPGDAATGPPPLSTRITIALVTGALATVAGELTGPARDATARLRRRMAALEFRGERSRADEVRDICTRQAGRWQQVAERMRRAGPAGTTAGRR